MPQLDSDAVHDSVARRAMSGDRLPFATQPKKAPGFDKFRIVLAGAE